MNKLTVVVITLNEEENLGRCLDSVKGIADEIVVVDSFSTDKTSAIALSHNAKFIERAFNGFIEQKNFAVVQAGNDYVLNLDADECLSETLRKNIIAAKQTGFASDAYSMNRLNFYCGKAVKTCGWYPDTKIRFWNRRKGQWQGELVHEKLVMKPGSAITHLEGDLLHYSFPDKQALMNQSKRFADLAAQQLKKQPAFFLLLKLFFSAPFKFLRNYFFKLGFTDGLAGFTICYYQSTEVFVKYWKALNLKQTSS